MSLKKAVYSDVEEISEEVAAVVSGQIPPWLSGTLLRNGPAKFSIGKYKYRHWFDGLAMLHRFRIANGQVSYFNKFLRSEAYVEGMKEQRIVRSEFATNSIPDPCQSLFSRFFSLFSSSDDTTDNCAVNVISVKEKQFAVTEAHEMVQIDPNTLEVLGRVNIMEEFPGELHLFGATAHPHIEEDGTVYNLSITYGRQTRYKIISIPPRSGDVDEKPLDGGRLVASIPPKAWKPAYFHSFGMTENFFVVSENPLLLNILKLATMELTGLSVYDCMSWDPTKKSYFYIVDRNTGEIVTTCAPSEPTFIFHHVNAFESDGQVIMDACCYPDASVVHSLLLESLLGEDESSPNSYTVPQLRRYILPIKKPDGQSEPKIQELEVGSNGLDYDVLHPLMEMPRIHYVKYNTRRYKYVYGLSAVNETFIVFSLIVKVNVETKEAKTWHEENCFPSEPVFVPAPNSEAEDEGVVLSVILNANTKKSFLLVLDAVTFQEVARAEVPVHISAGLHGVFLEN